MTRHTMTGRDWHTPVKPMTEARRREVYGPLEPMPGSTTLADVIAYGGGWARLIGGTALIAALAVVVALLVAGV